MRLRHLFAAACALLALPAAAAPKPVGRTAKAVTPARPVVETPERIEVHPAQVALTSRRDGRQLVVTGYYGGTARDLTHRAEYQLSDPRVAGVKGGRVTPSRDGASVVTVRVAGKAVRVPVTVSNQAKADPVRFKSETLAVLTKQGCAGGSCHGSPHGKGGFSLSLFGYDPQIDRVSLTRDGFNRRINVMEPAESLILKKPLLEVSHGGGRRLRRDEAPYRILHDWIYDGASADVPKTECDQLIVHPGAGRVLRAPYLKQQISVLAHFTDGTLRDVTPIATFESSHPSVASVSPEGLVTGLARGQAAISVRYLDRLESVHVTVVQDVPGFAWPSAKAAPPENNWIDRLVHDKLRQLQYLPSETCTDEVFVRRLHLDLTGLLPEAERVRRFLKDAAPDKRARLVDELLETEEFARFWALKKADLMRVSPRRLKDGRAERFSEWLVQAMRTNMPYDRFAREILTASGDSRSVAPASYFVAIPAMEERTEMTAQLFLGSRLECARCHNHPFESWTMRDYYSISAVFARTDAKDGVVRLAQAGEAQHPTTKEPMRPWGAAGTAEPADRRAAFAEWLTKPGNPYFARVEVNRIWADLLGRGIVDPVDDFRSSNPPANVPLLDALARELEKSGYDRKHVIRLICNSRAYQRSTATQRFNEQDEALFSRARVRLLTAEQLKDAIGFVTRGLAPPSTVPARLTELRPQAAARAAEVEAGFPAWLASVSVTGLPKPVAEALATPAERRTEAQTGLLREHHASTDARLAGLRREIAALESRAQYATQRPYPETTAFTAAFGQPERETACTCERQSAPTLLQALELLNGGTAHAAATGAADRYAPLDDERLVEELYLSAYSRFPTTRERQTALQHLRKGTERREAVVDLVWTVLSTQEFLFQH